MNYRFDSVWWIRDPCHFQCNNGRNFSEPYNNSLWPNIFLTFSRRTTSYPSRNAHWALQLVHYPTFPYFSRVWTEKLQRHRWRTSTRLLPWRIPARTISDIKSLHSRKNEWSWRGSLPRKNILTKISASAICGRSTVERTWNGIAFDHTPQLPVVCGEHCAGMT